MLKNFDFLLLLSILIIAALGLAVIWSIAPEFFVSQLVFLLFGFLVFLLFGFADYRIFKNYSFHLYVSSLVLLILPFVFGQVTRGAIRWIKIGSFTLQPSEIAKPLLISFFASFLSARHETRDTRQALSLFFLISIVFLIFKQPDLGSTLVVLAIWVGILVASGVNMKWLVVGGLWLVISSPLVWHLLKDYQKARILSFLNPYADPLGTGYNLVQSMIAVGSGRFFGRGLGRGTQSHLYFLPERHTDFIFASLVEEMGVFGGFLFLVFYFALFFRILKVAKTAADDFGFLVCIGVFSFLFFQVFVHLGMNLGLLPITGITLPLVSTGGSSILATMISLGLVESVARERRAEEGVRIK